MFFDIAILPNNGLPKHSKLGKWTISTDLGWTETHKDGDTVFEKGLLHNRCAIRFHGDQWRLETPEIKTFPLWASADGLRVSNCVPLHEKIHNFNQVKYEDSLVIEYQEPTWVEAMFNRFDCLDKETLVEKISTVIVEQAKKLAQYRLPVLVPATGGVDTTVVRSALDYAGVDYSVAGASRSQSQSQKYILEHNRMAEGNFWGYKQMADTITPHIQATGFWGDEYLQRNPVYTHMYLQHFNKDITKAYDDQGHSYMRNFFDHHYRNKVKTFDCTSRPRRRLQDMVLNDFQAWHIDECLTWTPLGDIEILKLSLRATPEVAIDQCVNAGLSMSIIETLNPHNLRLLDENKNRRSAVDGAVRG
jgi:hypothetical protein